MKKLQSLISALLFALTVFVFQSCEKNENQVVLVSSKNPILTANQTMNLPLTLANKDNEAVKFTWTNPDYRFNTGISSQAVNYDIEIDTTGKNFTGSSKQIIALSNDLSLSITQGTFNDYLLNQLNFRHSVPVTIDVRVRAYIKDSPATTVYSNTIKYATTPYFIPPKVAPPSTNELYVTGGATPLSWQCGCATDLTTNYQTTQKFTRISPTVYEIASINLTGGGSYLLLPVYGSWSAKFGFDGPNNGNNENADNFKDNGGDIKAPPVTGSYKIVVDFQKGKFFVTKL